MNRRMWGERQSKEKKIAKIRSKNFEQVHVVFCLSSNFPSECVCLPNFGINVIWIKAIALIIMANEWFEIH